MARGFSFADDPIALPTGAWASAERRTLRYDGRPVLSLSQGRRAYVYPLYTPAGFAVTSESPADHPHHNSFWIAADHVHCLMPAAGGRVEEYTYNFYVNDTFQGRAPGRIVATGAVGEAAGPSGFRIVQTIEWRGPEEWAAPVGGRLAARETRILQIGVEVGLYVIDVESQLSAAGWDFKIGPTRHSYFNVRMAELIAVTSGGVLRDDRGRSGGEAISGTGARWIDYSGPVGGGHVAGIAVCPDPRNHPDPTWFVTDWGVVTVGPFREQGRVVRDGETVTLRYRTLVHDGSAEEAGIAKRLAAYVDECAAR